MRILFNNKLDRNYQFLYTGRYSCEYSLLSKRNLAGNADDNLWSVQMC